MSLSLALALSLYLRSPSVSFSPFVALSYAALAGRSVKKAACELVPVAIGTLPSDCRAIVA